MVSDVSKPADEFALSLMEGLELNPAELRESYVAAKDRMEIDSLTKLRLQLQLTSSQMEPQLHEEQERAREIAKTIPELARREAANGKRYAGIMKLLAEDFTKIPEYMDTLEPEFLTPSRAPYFLYQLCVEKGLDPKIRPWHEIEGFRSGFELTINW